MWDGILDITVYYKIKCNKKITFEYTQNIEKSHNNE